MYPVGRRGTRKSDLADEQNLLRPPGTVRIQQREVHSDAGSRAASHRAPVRRPRLVRLKGRHVVTQGSPGNLQRCGRRQHRRLCVRQPRQAGHRHADRELRPAGDSGRRPELLQFGDDVLYEIHIDNNGDAKPDVTYQFRFRTVNTIPDTFLYNVGPIESLDQRELEPQQFYTVTRIANGDVDDARQRPAPARRSTSARTRPRTTPRWPAGAIHSLPGRRQGVRRPARRGFLRRPRRDLRSRHAATRSRTLHPSSMPASGGINATKAKNIHTIAIQVPKTDLTKGGYDASDADGPALDDRRLRLGQPADARACYGSDGTSDQRGPVRAGLAPGQPAGQRGASSRRPEGQVERVRPGERQRLRRSRHASPSSPGCCHVLYPGVFPNLAKYTKARVPTCSRSCSPASRPGSFPGSRTSPARRRPTCCG